MTKYLYTLDGGKISELGRLGYENFDFLSYEMKGEHEKNDDMISILENIHLSYLLGGCNIIGTNTFQVNLHSFKKLGIDNGQEILNKYINIAYNSLLKYEEIKRKSKDDINVLINPRNKNNISVYDYLSSYHNVRKKFDILHEKDFSFNIDNYLKDIKIEQSIGDNKYRKFNKSTDNYISFSNGPYSSTFADFSEYSGVMHKNKDKKGNKKMKKNVEKEEDEKKKKKVSEYYQLDKNIINNKNNINRNIKKSINYREYNKYSLYYDIQMNIPRLNFYGREKYNPIEIVPKIKKKNENINYKGQTNIINTYNNNNNINNNNNNDEIFFDKKLFNYGIEYYIDVSDQEIISNCLFKLNTFCKNHDKLHLFSLTTFSNIREVLTFYNCIKYYGSTFNNKVIINFFCNSCKYVGCSKYSFFDIVSILLYLDSYNKYIKAIGLNCVNIEYVYDLFYPFQKYICPYNNININLYHSQNNQMNNIVKNVMNDLKKNRYIYDMNFFCSPNKSLEVVSFDDANGDVHFHNSSNQTNHVYNYIGKWINVHVNGFGGCCYYNPYDISLINYKINELL
ncbi:putative homocysteine S-methyltransferase [Plasmodium gaboni]|uniref:Putative homocysteine S-methyltransferase n=1 Tax=Plasmodium gaboni TaxID=647221 RepID=A0A151LGV4_9APIC|nr:putative homocysteine S-methyltransferase [Plasmodium gaboni]KYN98136.1 putative homocysteine S-methyltransferase [Plasmodium gaboni]